MMSIAKMAGAHVGDQSQGRLRGYTRIDIVNDVALHAVVSKVYLALVT